MQTDKIDKDWYKSKMLWVNFIAILALIAQAFTGEVIDMSGQAALLAVVNIVLRLITHQELK